MIIQAVLIIGFILLMLMFLLNPNSYQVRAWIKLVGIGFTFLAVATVLFPESLNVVARNVGVTRGADLLLYLLTLAFIFVLLQSYVKGKQEHRRLVEVVRRLAILEAQGRKSRKRHAE